MAFIEENPNHPNIERARHEIYTAQGSDWFWWYGEPNNSGQDHLFDYLFREHLKNVYKAFDLPIPSSLDMPLSLISKPSSLPTGSITPIMDGQDRIDDEWLNAGVIQLPDIPYSEDVKVFKQIKFGFDSENLYLRLYIDEQVRENSTSAVHQMYMYMRNRTRRTNLSHIRLVSKTEDIFQLMREKFGTEIKISFINGMLKPLQFSKAMANDLWVLQDQNQIKIAYDNVIDISIPFEVIDIAENEMVEFFFAPADLDIMESAVPQELLLTMQRPTAKV